MHLRSSVRASLVLVAASVAYHFVAVEAIRCLWVFRLDWWRPQPALTFVGLAWMQFIYCGCLMAGSLPVALALQPVRRPLAFAFELALLGLVVPALWVGLPSLASYSLADRVSMVLGLAQLAGMLPLVTWLVSTVGCPATSLRVRHSAIQRDSERHGTDGRVVGAVNGVAQMHENAGSPITATSRAFNCRV